MRTLSRSNLIQIFDWLIGLPKVVPIVGLGVIAILGSLYFPWINIPSLDAAVINTSGQLELGTNACWVEIAARCVFSVLFMVVAIAWSRAKAYLVEKLLWMMMALVLLFPTSLLLWDPQFQLESERLDSSLAYVVEEMESLHNLQQGDWRVWQDFVEGSPKADTEVPQVISWATDLFNFTNFQLVLSGILGYSDSFLAFSTRGWVLGILGVVFGLLGFYVSDARLAGKIQSKHSVRPPLHFRKALGFFGGVYFSGLLLIQIPSMTAEYFIDRGDYFASIGSPQKAIDYYQKAIGFKPVYAFSSRFLVKRGHLLEQLGIDDTIDAYLFKAVAFLMAGDLTQASYWSDQAERVNPYSQSLVYLRSGILNLTAIKHFNAEEYSEAKAMWQHSLILDPLNASAWYGMSLASLQLKKFDEASVQSEQIYKLQKYLGFKSLVVPAQIDLYRSWHFFYINQFSAAHDAYRLSKLPESW